MSVDFFYFLSSLIHSTSNVCPRSFIFVGQSPGVFATLWARLMMLFDHHTDQFSLYSVVVTLFDLCCFGSCIIPYVHTESTTKDFACIPKLIMNQFTHWLVVVCSLLAWNGNTAPYSLIQLCTSYLMLQLDLKCRCESVWCWTGKAQTLGENSGQRREFGQWSNLYLTYLKVNSVS